MKNIPDTYELYTTKSSTKTIPITYNFITGDFYIRPKRKDAVIRELISDIVADLCLGRSSLVKQYEDKQYRDFITELATRVVGKYSPPFFESDGRLDLSVVVPDIKKLKKYEKEVIWKKFHKLGYFNFVPDMKSKIDEKIDFSKGEVLYREVLKIPIGETDIHGTLVAAFGEMARDFVNRGLGWGSNLFAYAADVGMESRARDAFVLQVSHIYQRTYEKPSLK